jgi:hypothetical protein
MADEARLVIELKDTSGSLNKTSPGTQSSPNTSSGTNDPRADKYTVDGAGHAAGAGSEPHETSTVVPPASSTEGVEPTPVSVPSNPPDKYTATVRDIVTSDPGATSKEISTALGIEQSRVDSILNTIRQEQTVVEQTQPKQPDIQQPPTTQEQPTQVNTTVVPEPTPTDTTPEPEQPEGVPYTPDTKMVDEALEHERRTNSVDNKVSGKDTNPGGATVGQTAAEVERILNNSGIMSVLPNIAGIPQIAQATLSTATTVASMSGTSLATISPALASFAGVALPVAAASAAALAIPAAAYYGLTQTAEMGIAQTKNIDGRVAAAEAEASVMQIQSNFKTAEILGDELAEYRRNQAELSSNFQRTRDVISEPFLRDLNTATNVLSKGIEALNNTIDSSEETRMRFQEITRNAAYGAAVPVLGGFVPKILDMLESKLINSENKLEGADGIDFHLPVPKDWEDAPGRIDPDSIKLARFK